MPTYHGEEVNWTQLITYAHLANREHTGRCTMCGENVRGLILKCYTNNLPNLPMFLCWACFSEEFNTNELFQQVDIADIIDVPATCFSCNAICTIRNFVIVNNSILCPRCANNLRAAEDRIAPPQPERSIEHFSVTRELREDYCYVCNTHISDCIEVSDREGRPLRVCERCYENGEYLIHPYSYNPEFKFYSTPSDKRTSLYFGIELEIERTERKIKQGDIIKSLPNFVYVKQDGSLRDGIEIVSHPATYRWLKENTAKWGAILDLRKLGWCSFHTETCGMHIHLSKAAFGNLHLYKFMTMLYDKKNYNFILNISQRTSSKLANWASTKDSEKNMIYKAKHKTYGEESRHTAVNLGRENSVEIRIFKGTLHPPSFWKNVEFAKAVFDFSYAFPKSKMNEKEFRGFLRYKRKEYPYLHEFLWGEKQFIAEE